MWIQAREGTEQLKLPEMEEPVEFSENGTAQVTKEVGKYLMENAPGVTEASNE